MFFFALSWASIIIFELTNISWFSEHSLTCHQDFLNWYYWPQTYRLKVSQSIPIQNDTIYFQLLLITILKLTASRISIIDYDIILNETCRMTLLTYVLFVTVVSSVLYMLYLLSIWNVTRLYSTQQLRKCTSSVLKNC